MKATSEEFELRLRAEPGYDVPATKRLAHALKVLLRQFGFKCTRIERVEPARPDGSKP
jgi:hypothetical protein